MALVGRKKRPSNMAAPEIEQEKLMMLSLTTTKPVSMGAGSRWRDQASLLRDLMAWLYKLKLC